FSKAPESLRHDHATVNRQRLTVDVAGGGAGEVGDGVGDVARAAEAARRYLLQVALAHLFWQRVRHVRLDEPGCDGVHGDATPAVLARQRLRESDQPGLGRDVVGLARVAPQRHYRADVDDAPRLRLEQVAQRRAGQVEGGRQVG